MFDLIRFIKIGLDTLLAAPERNKDRQGKVDNGDCTFIDQQAPQETVGVNRWAGLPVLLFCPLACSFGEWHKLYRI
jgi:hypothetical protein